MVLNSERNAATPANSRITTPPHHSDAQEANSGVNHGSPPTPSVADLVAVARAKRFRATADAIRDAIGEGGRVQELPPSEAAERGCLGTLKSLHRRGRLTFGEGLCEAAAKGGQLEVLKWLRTNNCPWDEGKCNLAAHFGHLKILRWACANGCQCSVITCGNAATGGHLEILKWLRENGYPWDAETCGYAANGGILDLLKWARANGCPWDVMTCGHAAREGREDGCVGGAERAPRGAAVGARE